MRTKVIVGFIVLASVFALVVSGSASDSSAKYRSSAVGKTVTISNFQFAPKSVTVKVGSVVTWVKIGRAHV